MRHAQRRGRPGRPIPLPMAETIGPTWCRSQTPAGSSSARRWCGQPIPDAGGGDYRPGSTVLSTAPIPASASISTCIPKGTKHEVPSPCRSIFWTQSVPWKKQGASLRPRRRDCESLRQAEIRRMERIQTAFEQLGAGIHSRLLSVANLVRARSTFRPCLLSKQFGQLLARSGSEGGRRSVFSPPPASNVNLLHNVQSIVDLGEINLHQT